MSLEDDPNAILRVCSYHRRDFDLVLVRSRPDEMLPVKGSLHKAFTTTPTSSLRNLDRLPTELMSMILRSLDLDSFFHFRQVSRRARVLSTDLWEYQLVAKHGLEGLRGLLRAGIGCKFTIADLYTPLVTGNCVLCGDFGGFLFLLTATRCCFACIKAAPELRVIAASTFARLTRTSQARLQMLLGPPLRTVPGLYSMDERRPRRPKFLLPIEESLQELLYMSLSSTSWPSYLFLGALHPKSQDQLYQYTELVERVFMASTAYPWYDRKTGEVDAGVSCKGCQIRVEKIERNIHEACQDRDRVFSASGFQRHFQSCVEAQNFWKESHGGIRPVEEPEFTRHCGFISRLGSDGLER